MRPEHQTILLDWYGPQRRASYGSCLSAGNRPQAHQAQNKGRSAEYFAWHDPLLINEAVRRRCCCRIVDRRVVSLRRDSAPNRKPSIAHADTRPLGLPLRTRVLGGAQKLRPVRLNRALARFWKQWPMSTSSHEPLRRAASTRTGILAVTMALDVGCLLVRSLHPNRSAKVSVWRRTTVDRVQSLHRISLERE